MVSQLLLHDRPSMIRFSLLKLKYVHMTCIYRISCFNVCSSTLTYMFNMKHILRLYEKCQTILCFACHYSYYIKYFYYALAMILRRAFIIGLIATYYLNYRELQHICHIIIIHENIKTWIRMISILSVVKVIVKVTGNTRL